MAEKNSKGIFDLSSVYDRVVAGNLPVTPTFTPENLNRNTVLQIQGKNAIAGNNNAFLDSSGNGLTLTPTGTPTQGSFSPFSPAGWSGNFNGSADYLNIPYNAAHALTNQNFTIEAWINPSVNSIEMGIINNWQGGGAFIFTKLNTNKLAFTYTNAASGTGTINIVGTTQTVIIGQWNHVAVVRNGATITLYLNGVADATTYAIGTNAIYYYNGGTKDIRIGTAGDLGLKFNGYISNLRMVVGFAVYTSNFTPSTAPLTAITGTVLLALQDNRFKDNSVTNNTVTVVGTPAVSPFSPFSQTAEYNKNVHGGSGYFNGSSYLSMPASELNNFGTGNFTIEMWVNPASLTTYNMLYVVGAHYLCLLWGATSSVFGINAYNGIVSVSSTTSVTSINQWTHVAFVRTSGIIYFYINGVAAGSGAFSGAFGESSSISTIGYSAAYSGQYYVNGYISNLRVVKGTALYTTTFTPPTAPLTPVTNTSLLVKFDNAAIVDSTAKNNLITVGDTNLSTAVTKFNKSAMYFDGTGDYITTSSIGLVPTTADFTIECWAYCLSYGDRGLVAQSTGSTGRLIIAINSSGNVSFQIGGTALTTTGFTVGLNQWTHIACTRVGSTVKVYFNGVQVATGTNSTSVDNVLVTIGNVPSYTQYWSGYIDDLRITNGIARYTSTFTPTPLEKDKTLALEVLIVAGGGGGGRKRTPGGGAGGLLYYGNNTTTKTPNGPPIIAYSGASYAVAVGLGGATNVSGANSSFGSYVSYGGQGNNSTVIGGSAAGSGTKLWTQGQGQGGGVYANGASGGGGGAGVQGGTGGVVTNVGGIGGNGLSYSEFTAVAGVPAGWFAGGGGGGGMGADAASGGAGGYGGGGYGGNVYGSQTKAYGYDGNAYTGGGGGGTSDVHSSQDGGLGAQGGSGIVIVSYAGTSALATGGTISTTARPGYVCHTFTGVGTFAVT